jgi:glycosyltransferase involved in cell wall biosynthesis
MSQEFKLPFWVVEEGGYKLYRNFVGLSTSGADYIRKRQAKTNLVIIPNAMEPEAFQFQDEPEENFITYMGRIDFHQKGLDLLLKAFAQITAKDDVKLRIIGGGNDEEQLHHLIDELNLKERVVLTGRMQGMERLRLLARSKFVALPSRYETSCLVAYEALACAKPMLSFDVRGFDDLITPESGVRVPPFDI